VWVLLLQLKEKLMDRRHQPGKVEEKQIEAIARRIMERMIEEYLDFDDYSLKGLLGQILKEIKKMSAETQAAIDEMKVEVARNTTVVDSAKALIASLLSQIEAAADDPEEIRAIVESVRANTDSLAEAIPANTPPVEEPPPETI
jgi:chromosome segregation ATPase